MTLSADDTRKIARLSRIRLNEDEIEGYTNELNGILHWIEQLQEVDTDGVEQMTSVADMALPMREDVVTDGNIQEKVLQNAPGSEYGCFTVPKVIE
ncbi:MAG: Asp-tRNA(Asn)/Glu-tRNA(Gln) amidotransferase GatCAB subunit C [Rickettsiales bacterium]|nr:Asp-tRNA(Asn)/Glu-tRNA(Gln) amidotransferase GatCAB subunit C [Rickettsiales bacterium]